MCLYNKRMVSESRVLPAFKVITFFVNMLHHLKAYFEHTHTHTHTHINEVHSILSLN